MRRLFMALCLFLPLSILAKSRIYNPQVKSLQAVVNQDWLSPAVMRLGSDDVLNVAFDELSHQYHRYIYKVEHCEADWTPSEELFESEWLEGFNDNTIDDYENSVNTTVAYTHYWLQIPNERCRLKLSGNYKLHVLDENNDNEEILMVEFMVTEQTMGLDLSVTTNTDIDLNASHQQVSMNLSYGRWQVTNPEDQIQTVVMQNQRIARKNVRPNYKNPSGSVNLSWTHNRALIFDAGNEYHKFEVLDVSHPTMGIERIIWDGERYQAYPFASTIRRNYLTDVSANGAFLIRNSDRSEINYTCEYVWVNYTLEAPYCGDIFLQGQWTNNADQTAYQMQYDGGGQCYRTQVMQKQGYYSFQYVTKEGKTAPTEGNFYQTRNTYQALVYYKGLGDRTWQLVGYHVSPQVPKRY